MISTDLLNELLELDRADKLEIIRLLQTDLDDESAETSQPALEPQRVYRIPSVWISPDAAEAAKGMMERDSESNG